MPGRYLNSTPSFLRIDLVSRYVRLGDICMEELFLVAYLNYPDLYDEIKSCFSFLEFFVG
jgi:hypothetical protein